MHIKYEVYLLLAIAVLSDTTELRLFFHLHMEVEPINNTLQQIMNMHVRNPTTCVIGVRMNVDRNPTTCVTGIQLQMS